MRDMDDEAAEVARRQELERYGIRGKWNPFITELKHRLGGIQLILKFPNGYGASIINNSMSYGVELAVLDDDGDLCYDTPVTDDVKGHLTPVTLDATLNQIMALPADVKQLDSGYDNTFPDHTWRGRLGGAR